MVLINEGIQFVHQGIFSAKLVTAQNVRERQVMWTRLSVHQLKNAASNDNFFYLSHDLENHCSTNASNDISIVLMTWKIKLIC